MATLFISCESLLFLNLTNFAIYDTTNVERILDNCNPNLILCYDESKMPSHFKSEVRQYGNSCLKVCIMNSKKFILNIEMCVDNCYSEIFINFIIKIYAIQNAL